MSAVARVLQLPELLEIIMLELAANALLTEEHNWFSLGGAPVLQPITALSPLHLVDHNFHDMLKGSARLQRAIFSQPRFLSSDMQLDRLGATIGLTGKALRRAVGELPTLPPVPLIWLGRKLWLHSENYHLGTANVLSIDTRRTGPSACPTKLEVLMSSSFGNDNSSWRRLQVYQSDITAERIQAFRVTFSPPKHGSVRQGSRSYYEKLNFEDGTLLGEIFERIVEIIYRKQDQHVAAAIAGKEIAKG